jgi:predicted kinase
VVARRSLVSVEREPTGQEHVQLVTVDGPALVLTVGPAASGKSTLLHELAAAGVVDATVSTDAVRAGLGLAPDETEMTYATVRGRVHELLAARRVVAVDATNVRAADRAVWLALARQHRATPVALRVGVGLDLEQLLVRDAARDRHVPAAVIAGQLALAAASGPAVLRAEGFTVIDAAPAARPAAVSG